MASQNFINAVMCICFAYSVMDVLLMDPDDCMLSMQKWLVISYVNVGVFRCTQKVGIKYSDEGENFIFSFRQKTLVPRLVVCCTWFLIVPFCLIWTVLGTLWLRSSMEFSPRCFANGTHPHLIMFWQFLSYVWICIYLVYFGIACVIERRLQIAEKNMRLVETTDSLSRWGRLAPFVSNSGPSGTTEALKPLRGLEPGKIHSLPSVQVQFDDAEMGCGMHCPICLSDFSVGEQVRQLPSCGHCFHQSCIDLWLVRQADCPMCKSTV